MTDVGEPHGTGELRLNKTPDGELRVTLAGKWYMTDTPPSPGMVRNEIEAFPEIARVSFEARDLTGWDSSLLTFLLAVIDFCSQRAIPVDREGLPAGLNRLLRLATAVPERKGTRRGAGHEPFLARAGEAAIAFLRSTREMLAFIGETAAAFLRLVTGKSRFRGSDLLLVIQECSAEALPIVSLISLLVGRAGQRHHVRLPSFRPIATNQPAVLFAA